jgi:hypothetical protein
MNDFLARLAGRALGRVPVLKPVAMRFARGTLSLGTPREQGRALAEPPARYRARGRAVFSLPRHDIEHPGDDLTGEWPVSPGLRAMSPGFASNPEARGFESNSEARGFESNSEARGFESNPEARGFESNPEARGFESNPEARGFASNPEARSDATETHARVFPPSSVPKPVLFRQLVAWGPEAASARTFSLPGISDIWTPFGSEAATVQQGGSVPSPSDGGTATAVAPAAIHTSMPILPDRWSPPAPALLPPRQPAISGVASLEPGHGKPSGRDGAMVDAEHPNVPRAAERRAATPPVRTNAGSSQPMQADPPAWPPAPEEASDADASTVTPHTTRTGSPHAGPFARIRRRAASAEAPNAESTVSDSASITTPPGMATEVTPAEPGHQRVTVHRVASPGPAAPGEASGRGSTRERSSSEPEKYDVLRPPALLSSTSPPDVGGRPVATGNLPLRSRSASSAGGAPLERLEGSHRTTRSTPTVQRFPVAEQHMPTSHSATPRADDGAAWPSLPTEAARPRPLTPAVSSATGQNPLGLAPTEVDTEGAGGQRRASRESGVIDELNRAPARPMAREHAVRRSPLASAAHQASFSTLRPSETGLPGGTSQSRSIAHGIAPAETSRLDAQAHDGASPAAMRVGSAPSRSEQAQRHAPAAPSGARDATPRAPARAGGPERRDARRTPDTVHAFRPSAAGAAAVSGNHAGNRSIMRDSHGLAMYPTPSLQVTHGRDRSLLAPSGRAIPSETASSRIIVPGAQPRGVVQTREHRDTASPRVPAEPTALAHREHVPAGEGGMLAAATRSAAANSSTVDASHAAGTSRHAGTSHAAGTSRPAAPALSRLVPRPRGSRQYVDARSAADEHQASALPSVRTRNAPARRAPAIEPRMTFRRDARPGPGEAAQGQDSASESTIRVRIGQITVHAASPQQRAPARPQPSTLSLSEYLRRREEASS